MKKILIVDDQPLTRKGIALTLEAEPDLAICCQRTNGEEVLTSLDAMKPDVAIVDLSQPGMSSLEVVRRMHARWSEIPILVLSTYDRPACAVRALRAGARGYVTKSESTDVVMDAVRHLLDGGLYVSEELNAQLLSDLADETNGLSPSPLDALSERELEVFELIGHGFSTHEVADRLDLSVKTVESYRQRIKHKLNLPSASHLLRHAIQWAHGEEVC